MVRPNLKVGYWNGLDRPSCFLAHGCKALEAFREWIGHMILKSNDGFSSASIWTIASYLPFTSFLALPRICLRRSNFTSSQICSWSSILFLLFHFFLAARYLIYLNDFFDKCMQVTFFSCRACLRLHEPRVSHCTIVLPQPHLLVCHHHQRECRIPRPTPTLPQVAIVHSYVSQQFPGVCQH